MIILLLMLLCHIIDDFVLQPCCLSKLKQKSIWTKYPKLYKHDYLMALFIHSLSWSIMIHLPLMILCPISDFKAILSVLVNLVIHFIIDDLKANRGKINLIFDQTVHMIQIILTFIILS